MSAMDTSSTQATGSVVSGQAGTILALRQELENRHDNTQSYSEVLYLVAFTVDRRYYAGFGS